MSDYIIHYIRGPGVITLSEQSPYRGYITDGPGDFLESWICGHTASTDQRSIFLHSSNPLLVPLEEWSLFSAPLLLSFTPHPLSFNPHLIGFLPHLSFVPCSHFFFQQLESREIPPDINRTVIESYSLSDPVHPPATWYTHPCIKTKYTLTQWPWVKWEAVG